MYRVLVHYSEIGLKGKNKSDYELLLVLNIKKSAKYFNLDLKKIVRDNARTHCYYSKSNNKEIIIEHLQSVFGIKNFSFIEKIEKNIESLKLRVTKQLEELKKNGIKIVSFKTKRNDKAFSLNSPQINSEYGKIATDLGIKVDYKNLDNVIYTDITFKEVFFYSQKIKGPGGLPIGSTGRVLVLLSGGIDSPVAAYQLMRRGCIVDYIHIHNLATNELAKKSKIINTVKKLNKYQQKSTIYLVSYSNFEIATMGKLDPRIELVYFKHYILKLAATIANQNEYGAIAIGDNLAQVASQTLENLQVTSNGINCLIFRPLLAYEKEEIINFAKNIGTYNRSIEEYKDCCSLVSNNPYTKTKIEKLNKALEIVNVDEIIEKSIKNLEKVRVS